MVRYTKEDGMDAEAEEVDAEADDEDEVTSWFFWAECLAPLDSKVSMRTLMSTGLDLVFGEDLSLSWTSLVHVA